MNRHAVFDEPNVRSATKTLLAMARDVWLDRIEDLRLPDLALLAHRFDAGSIGEWRSLTREQQAFLRTLRSLGERTGDESFPVSEVYYRAIVEHGPIFRDDQLRARVTKPLTDTGAALLHIEL